MSILEDLKKIIIKAGDECLKFYNNKYSSEIKKNDFPLTKADLASNELIIKSLKKISNYAILSEESKIDNKRLNERYLWIIDPLDGTKDFINKTGEFSVMVALIDDTKIKMGLVYQPTVNKLYYALKDHGSYLEQNGKITKLQVSKENDFAKRKILLSRHHLNPADIKFKKISGIGLSQTFGSAGLKLGLIAQGDSHIYLNISPKTGEWDIAAGKIILEEAGGKVTDIYGQELIFNKKEPFNNNGFISSNNVDHQLLVEILSKCL